MVDHENSRTRNVLTGRELIHHQRLEKTNETTEIDQLCGNTFRFDCRAGLAQEAYVYGPAPYAGPPEGPMVYRSYGQIDPDYLPPRNNDEYWNLRNHGFTGRSPSRVGGESPNLNPSGS
jgi:hypothetical protein